MKGIALLVVIAGLVAAPGLTLGSECSDDFGDHHSQPVAAGAPDAATSAEPVQPTTEQDQTPAEPPAELTAEAPSASPRP